MMNKFCLTRMILLAAINIFVAGPVFASSKQCETLFEAQTPAQPAAVKPVKKIGKIEVNAQAEPDKGARIRAEAEVIARVAHELGLEVPAHQLNIVPSGQLDLLAGTGGHPAPHWHDGSEVVSSKESVRGVLEFVTKGCPTCRAYYSASTPHVEQRSVIMHVAGHNDVSSTSIYYTSRPGDAPLASIHLAKALGRAYSQFDHDEVALFYQYMKSLDRLQDFTNGTFEDPATFSNARNHIPLKQPEAKSFWEAAKPLTGGLFGNLVKGAKPQGPEERTGWHSTYSILQAMSELLPPDAPEWQVALMRLNEQSHRAYPSTFQTKILNEGWATLQMYIIARHLPNVTSSDLVKYSQLLSGVVYKDFKNPYWLGLSGWMNVYDQFMERPELAGLSDLEKDKRFIAFARPKYARMNDSAWAKFALDQRWIEKNGFFLYRQTMREEIDWTGDPQKQKFIALSRNWKRIQNFIISKYVDVKFRQIPSIKLLNPNHTQGTVSFQQDTSEGIPLEITTATKTLFVIAQIMQKPAEIDALFQLQTADPDHESNHFGPPRPLLKVFPTKLKVSVQGEVTVHVEGKSLAPLAEQLEKFVDEYKVDVLGTFRGDVADHQVKQWTRLASQVSDVSAEHVSTIVDFAPHTGPAIREYLQVVETRLRASIRDVLTGKVKGHLSGTGMTLPVLPEVPTFHYDNSFVVRRIQSKPPGPVDKRGEANDHDFHVDENGTMIGQLRRLPEPGDKWTPKDDGKGKGKGKGEPSDEEGEPGDEESPGNGNGSGDPKDIKIPLELYGQLLGEVLELPNIRRTIGKVPEVQTIRRGVISKPSGNILWDQTMIVAIEKARAIRKGKGLPFDSSVDVGTLVREALPLLEPGDIRVSGTMDKPIPDFDAVLLVNIDLTGSMMGERIANAKNLVFNMKALLKAKYKNVHIVYVGFDSTARELTEKQAFSTFFGGGTAYGSASKLDKEILKRYPNARFNKYIVTIGDAETSGQDAQEYVSDINDLRSDLQYAGLAVTNESDVIMNDVLVNAHLQLKNEWPWVGVARLRDRSDMLQALKDLFAGDEKK